MLENEDANRKDKTLGVLFQNPDSEEEDLNWQWLDEEDLKKITTDWEAIVRVLDINFDNIGVDTPKQEIDREINAIPRYVLDDIKEKINPNKCEIESGYRALDEHLKYRDYKINQKDYGDKADRYHRKLRETNDRNIKETKCVLLETAHKALHHQCPLARLIDPTSFGIMWEDYDFRIVCQLVDNLRERNKEVPEHLIILAQGVYTELINDKEFQAADLRIYNEYLDYDKYLGKDRYIPRLEAVDPSHFQIPLRYRDGKVHKDHHELLSNFSEYKKQIPSLDNDPDKSKRKKRLEELKKNKRQEKWEKYLEHDLWVQELAPDDYKAVWEEEKAWVRNKFMARNIKNTKGAYVIWAIDHLKRMWLEKGIPLYPNQRIVKEYLQKVQPVKFDPIKMEKDNFKRPSQVTRQWVFFPAADHRIKV